MQLFFHPGARLQPKKKADGTHSQTNESQNKKYKELNELKKFGEEFVVNYLNQ